MVGLRREKVGSGVSPPTPTWSLPPWTLEKGKYFRGGERVSPTNSKLNLARRDFHFFSFLGPARHSQKASSDGSQARALLSNNTRESGKTCWVLARVRPPLPPQAKLEGQSLKHGYLTSAWLRNFDRFSALRFILQPVLPVQDDQAEVAEPE